VGFAARYAARSDIGRHRQTNEDSWLARPPLFAVADGMGGAQAGEVASRVALETLAARAARVEPLARAAAGESLLAACREANDRVWQLAHEHASRAGMGTTLTALALCADGARLAHIGDSRAYLLRGGELAQISDDHSLVGEMVRSGELAEEDAAAHPLRSILSRALGTEQEPRIDLLDIDLLAGDVLLLCSDGLTGPVPDSQIALMLAEPDPEEAARRLVDAALRAGGPDNITVVVVRLEEAPAANGGGEATADAAGSGTVAVPGAPVEPDPDGSPGAGALTADAANGAAPAAAAADGAAPEAAGSADVQEDPGELADATGLTMIVGAAEAGTAAAAATNGAPNEPGLASSDAAETDLERPYLGGAAAPSPSPSATPVAGKSAARGSRRWLRWFIVLAVIAVVVAVAVVVVGQLEWVGVSDTGAVTVNRGLPWEFAGVRLYREHEVTTLRYADLSAADQQKVDTHSLGWRGSGERLVAELRGEAP